MVDGVNGVNGRGHKLDQPFTERFAQLNANLICDLAQCGHCVKFRATGQTTAER